jgi:DNA mismatch repair protein MutL
MPEIQKLPVEVYEKIKAGEVIEDPASVIRELLDNALDAKASAVEVEIQEGGISGILVRDNGKGMEAEDVRISFQPHTTSKIRKFEDIFSLSTAGFRGEALASIAKVSHLKIASRAASQEMGYSIFAEGGNLLRESPEAHSQGTTIEVNNLFFNVPVRKNFLKSPVRESRKIHQEILVKALSFPDVRFSYKLNGKSVFNYPSQPWEERIRTVFEAREKLLPFYSRTPDISIKGVVTDLNQTYNTSGKLYFFINNKYIRPRFLYGVVNQIFSQLIPRGRYPGGVIYLYTDPKNIDPNVHPSKKEIKIFIEDVIYRQLYKTLKNLFFSEKNDDSPSKTRSFEKPGTNSKNPPSPKNPVTKDQEPVLDFGENKSTEAPTPALPSYRYLGTAFETYWIIQQNEELFFIDFHAAHERMRFEKLKETSAENPVQMLLTPRIFHYSKLEISRIGDYKEQIESLGFSFYFFGEDALVVNGIPSFYKNSSWEQDFKDAIQDFFNQKEKDPAALKEEMLKSIACRGSYMSGEVLPESEVHELVPLILERKIPHTCPHGRPFIHRMGQKELAGKFLRNG